MVRRQHCNDTDEFVEYSLSFTVCLAPAAQKSNAVLSLSPTAISLKLSPSTEGASQKQQRDSFPQLTAYFDSLNSNVKFLAACK